MLLKEQLKFEEGLSTKAYLCPAGKKTIGYGHNLDANPCYKAVPIPDEITEESAEELLEHDIKKTWRELKKAWPQVDLLPVSRQDACINMAFQMGIYGFMEFRKMRYELISGHYKNAAKEALNSEWAKQTPARAKRVASQLLTGEYYSCRE